MKEYSALTGREYAPILTYLCDDAEYVMIGLGSVTDDVQAVATHLRARGQEGRRDLGQAPAAVPRGRARRRARRQEGGHRARALGRHRAHHHGPRGAVQGARERRRRAAPRHCAARQSAQDHDGDFRSRRARPAAAPPRRRVQEHGDAQRAVRLSRLAVLLQEPAAEARRTAGEAEGRLSRHRADGARDRAEPGAAAEVGLPHPLPFGRRLRHHRHRQAPHRHSRRRARPAFQGRAEIRLGEERRPDQLLHHAQPRAGSDHQRRARGRRTGRFAGPQGVQPLEPAARARRGRNFHPAVESRSFGHMEGAARAGAQDHPRQEDQVPHHRGLRGRQETRADARTRDAHDGHRLHRRGVREFRPGYRGRPGRGGAEQDPPADRQEIRGQGRPGGRRQHGGDPRRPQGHARGGLHPARIRRGRQGAGTQERAHRRHLGPHVPGRTVARAIGLPRRRVFRRRDGLGLPRRDDRRGAGDAGRGPVPPGRQRGLQGQGTVPPHRAGIHRGSVHRMHGMRARLPGRRDPECGSRHPRAPDGRHPPARHRREPTGGAAARGLSDRRRGAGGLSQREAPAAVP